MLQYTGTGYLIFVLYGLLGAFTLWRLLWRYNGRLPATQLIGRLCPRCSREEDFQVDEGGEWSRLLQLDGRELCLMIRYRGNDPANCKIPVSSRPPHIVFAVPELPRHRGGLTRNREKAALPASFSLQRSPR